MRALVLDEQENALLVNFNWAGLASPAGFWACPGGGIDPGESPEAALRRELAEEVGLDDPHIVGPVWRLTRMFPMQHWDGQTDVTYLVRAAHFEPCPRVDLLAENVHAIRWFSPAEIARGTVTFSPRDLDEQLTTLRAHGVPGRPREIAALD